ncbi:MAG: EAL domain-containing protein [Hyphomicrobiaceae bacterium]
MTANIDTQTTRSPADLGSPKVRVGGPAGSIVVDALVLAAILTTALAAAFALIVEFAASPGSALGIGITLAVILVTLHVALRKREMAAMLTEQLREAEGRLATLSNSPAPTTATDATSGAPGQWESGLVGLSRAEAKSAMPAAHLPANHELKPAPVLVIPGVVPDAPAQSIAGTMRPAPMGSESPTAPPGERRAPELVLPEPDFSSARPLPADADAIRQVLERMAQDISREQRQSEPALGSAATQVLSAALTAKGEASAPPVPPELWQMSNPDRGQGVSAQTGLVGDGTSGPASRFASAPVVPASAGGGGEVGPSQAGGPRPPAPPSLPTAKRGGAGSGIDRVAAIAAALAQERIDVLLEPILGLEDQGPRHFEVAVRLRLDGATSLDREGYTLAAAGTPLLPLIDTLAIARSRRVVWKLETSDQAGRVFTGISGGALRDPDFLSDTQGLLSGDRAADRMVLSFAQSEISLLGNSQRQALTNLRGIGFRFAIDQVTHVDMDFAAVVDLGFEFVKIDAEVFLDGLPVGEDHVPADDLCRFLAAAGLTPIVSRIRDASQRQRLRACGVSLGQGSLFGPPITLKADWMRTPKRDVN